MAEFTPLSFTSPNGVNPDGSLRPAVINGIVGQAISTLTPTIVGGTGPKIISLGGSLPAGLSFNSATGAISGTPTAASLHRRVAINVQDAFSNASIPVVVGVEAPYATGPANYLAPGLPAGPSGRITLPGGDVVIFFTLGDSQLAGTGNPANLAAYKASYVVADPTQVLTLNRAGAWVTYDPNTYAGEDFASGTKVGPELTFAMDFAAKYTNKLRIIKYTKPGSFMGEGVPLPVGAPTTTNITTNGTAQIVTNSGAAIAINDRLKGGTLPLNAYAWQIGPPIVGARFGEYSGSSPAPQTFTAGTFDINRYDGLNSWSLTQGGLYVGSASSSFRGRNKFMTALNGLGVAGTDYTVRGIVPWTGTNDASDNTNTASYPTERNALYSDFRTFFSLPTVKMATIQVKSLAGNFDTIRTSIANYAAANPSIVSVVEVTDLQASIWDGTHFDYPALGIIGQRAMAGVSL